MTLVHRHRGGVVPAVKNDLDDEVPCLELDVLESITAFDLRRAVRLVTDAVAALNRDLEVTKPWQLAKCEGADRLKRAELDGLLARFISRVRAIGRAVEPIVPGLSARVLAQVGDRERLPAPTPVFAKIETA